MLKRPTGIRPKLKIGFKVVMTRQKAWRTSYCGQAGFWFLDLFVALDVTAHCICETYCSAQEGFDLNAVHKQSSTEKKS